MQSKVNIARYTQFYNTENLAKHDSKWTKMEKMEQFLCGIQIYIKPKNLGKQHAKWAKIEKDKQIL